MLLDLLRQHPKTGGESGEHLANETDDEPDGIKAFSAEKVNEVREKLKIAARMESQTPRYAEEIYQDTVNMVPGIDDIDEITSAITASISS